MRQLSYRLTFHTPAFLGNAEQAGQWRTPPIKALLRQWWRVVYNAGKPKGANAVQAMRQAEGQLFGHAWLDNDTDQRGNKVAARRSQLRLRLSAWELGTLSASRWAPLPALPHPEVRQSVAADLYLGFGAVVLPRGQRTPTLKSAAAIQGGEHGCLGLACPEEHLPSLTSALALLDRFGTLGGRSRNGWGSFSLAPLQGAPAHATELAQSLTLPWQEAVRTDWPQAIGVDDVGPLIWQTEPLADWKLVMHRLAEIKMALRTGFKFPDERPDGQVHDRHWLSYPVTRHEVAQWKRDGLRMPNTLRFKVRPAPDGKLRGVVFHMPCMPPPAFRPDDKAIERVWQKVHSRLDAHPSLTRTSA